MSLKGVTHEEDLPRVLVLMATYQGARWVQEQINSVLNQQGVCVRLLVSDDCSIDGTAEIVRDIASDDARVQIADCLSPSGSAGANFRRLYEMASLADSDFVALCDQDDIWLPGKLLAAIDILRSSGSAGYSCAVRAFWPDGRVRNISQSPHIRACDFLFEGAGQGCTFVVTKVFFARAQEFCRHHSQTVAALHYHDWLLYLLARAWQLGWDFDQRSWLRYRQHDGNEIGSRGGASAIAKRLALIRSGWYLAQVRAASRVYLIAQPAESAQRPSSLAAVWAVEFSASKSSRNFGQRFKSLLRIMQHGRRRCTDRLVLALAVVAGWL